MWQPVKALVTAVGFALVLLPRAAQADAAGDYASAQASLKQLKALPEERRRFRHVWQKAIDQFKQVAESWPKSPQAEKALYEEGELYLQLHDVSHLRADLESGAEAFQELEKRYPASTLADDALLQESRMAGLLGHRDLQATLLQSLLDRYPKGDMVAPARRDLAALKAQGTVTTASPTPPPSLVAVASALPSAAPTPTQNSSVAPVPSTPSAPASVPGKGPMSGGEAGESQSIKLPRIYSNEDSTRVVVYTGGGVHWQVGQVRQDGAKPKRIWIDLSTARVGEDVKSQTAKQADGQWEIPIGDGLLTRARIGQHDTGTVRVVLDVASMRDFQITPLDDPFRLLIDVDGAERGVADPPPTPGVHLDSTPTPLPTEALLARRASELKASEQMTGMTVSEQLGDEYHVVYVDAGHGGNDPGAKGRSGAQEKDVTLSVARLLRDALASRGFDARLTRTDDTFLALEERTGIAIQGKGNLFVSIHCNSKDPSSKTDPRGVETYYADVASSPAEARLAAIENAANPQDGLGLHGLLETLLRGDYTLRSAQLASAIQEQLSSDEAKVDRDIHNLKVKHALFYVLLTAKMPAVLVETSFISNGKDEKHLTDSKFQRTVADSIARAIEGFAHAHVAPKEATEVKGGAPSETPRPGKPTRR